MQLNTSEETSQLWRAVGDTVSNLSGLGIKPNTYRAHSDEFNQSANRQLRQFSKKAEKAEENTK